MILSLVKIHSEPRVTICSTYRENCDCVYVCVCRTCELAFDVLRMDSVTICGTEIWSL